MAKPPIIKFFSPDEQLNLALLKILNTYSNRLFVCYLDMIKNPDSELIHDTRVYGRRFQAVFEIYSPLLHSENDNKTILKIRKISLALKKIIELLGVVRDSEVTFQIISKLISKCDEPGSTSLMMLASNLRAEKVSGTDWLKKSRKLKNFIIYREYIDSLLEEKLEEDILPYLKETKFRENYQYMINLKYNEMIVRKDKVVGHPENIKDVHKMRIDAKLLRYLLEISPESFPKNFNSALNQIKSFTESVGELHDLDVAAKVTTNYLKNLDYHHSSGSLIKLLRELDEKRKELFLKIQAKIIKWDSIQLSKKIINLN